MQQNKSVTFKLVVKRKRGQKIFSVRPSKLCCLFTNSRSDGSWFDSKPHPTTINNWPEAANSCNSSFTAGLISLHWTGEQAGITQCVTCFFMNAFLFNVFRSEHRSRYTACLSFRHLPITLLINTFKELLGFQMASWEPKDYSVGQIHDDSHLHGPLDSWSHWFLLMFNQMKSSTHHHATLDDSVS